LCAKIDEQGNRILLLYAAKDYSLCFCRKLHIIYIKSDTQYVQITQPRASVG
jgi:hypothetical protein